MGRNSFLCLIFISILSLSYVALGFGILGTDIIGDDLSATNTLSSLACAEQCDITEACAGWVWNSCGSGSSNTCWLKKNISQLVPNSCRISLSKIGDIGVDRSGADMPGMPIMVGPTASSCADKCATTIGCIAWSFDSCGKSNCWLKNNITSSFSSSCRTSYVQEIPTFPQPEQCTGICSGIQDTFLIKRQTDGLYFRFSSFDGIQTAISKTISGPWVDAGPAFPDQISNNPIEHWTPDVHYINGLYYMYYTLYNTSAVGGARDRIQVATSPNLESGSWTQQGEIGLPEAFPVYSRIDSNLLLDSPENPFIAFGSYAWGLFGIRMESSLSPLRVESGNPQLIIASKSIPSDPGPTGLNRTEGTFMYYTGGYYYYFYAVGNCCPDANDPEVDVYHIEVCRGEYANGPYYSQNGVRCDTEQGGDGTLFFGSRQDRSVYSPGGVGIMDDGLNGLIFYYQFLNTSIGYPYPQLQWGYNIVEFQNGWPILV